METCVQLAIAKCTTTNITLAIDLWMNMFNFDTFCMVMYFIDDSFLDTTTHHSRIFEGVGMACATLVEIMKPLLNFFGLTNKFLVYVKDEGANMNTLVVALRLVVSCRCLQLDHCPCGNLNEKQICM